MLIGHRMKQPNFVKYFLIFKHVTIFLNLLTFFKLEIQLITFSNVPNTEILKCEN